EEDLTQRRKAAKEEQRKNPIRGTQKSGTTAGDNGIVFGLLLCSSFAALRLCVRLFLFSGRWETVTMGASGRPFSCCGTTPVHITAVCPLCRTSYQLQPSLRGQAIRCPNNLCRHVFVVTGDPPPTRADTGQQSGSVGDVVPIAPAQIAKEAP